MKRSGRSAGSGVLFLTVLGTVSQILGFLYRVALSRLAGAEVMGLYQLIMPVYSVLMSLTAVGLTTAISNLTAQYLAHSDPLGAEQTLSDCLRWFLLLLVPMGAVVIWASDALSVHVLGDARTQLGLILLVPCVALTGVENFHKHTFYGAGQVRLPALVEVLEQLVRTAAVLGLLIAFLPQYPERVVGLIVGGMVICEIFSSCTLVLLHRFAAHIPGSGTGAPPSLRRRRISAIAFPVGLNALLGNLLSAANATLIPQKLVEGGLSREAAVSAFGVVCGMTLPLLALPTVYLGPLNLVLSPRLTRAHSLGQTTRVHALTARAMESVSLLTLPAMGMMCVLGPQLGRLMFRQDTVGNYLLPLAAVMAMSCFCSVLANALNAVSQQRWVAGISLLGGGLQLLLTLFLVPLSGVGMTGYVAGALLSTALELVLMFLHLCRCTGLTADPFRWLVAPGLSAALASLVSNLLLCYLDRAGLPFFAAGSITLIFGILLYAVALSSQGISVAEIFSSQKRA